MGHDHAPLEPGAQVTGHGLRVRVALRGLGLHRALGDRDQLRRGLGRELRDRGEGPAPTGVEQGEDVVTLELRLEGAHAGQERVEQRPHRVHVRALVQRVHVAARLLG